MCTHWKNHLRSSGSTPGVIPCPRFAIHAFVSPLTRKLSHILFTSRSIAFLPPYRTFGSRFPWRATLSPTRPHGTGSSVLLLCSMVSMYAVISGTFRVECISAWNYLALPLRTDLGNILVVSGHYSSFVDPQMVLTTYEEKLGEGL